MCTHVDLVSSDVVHAITPVDRVSSMPTAYERAMTLSKIDSGRRRGSIDESWLQGRGVFGGVLAASMLRSIMEDVSDSERVPRSLTVHFCAPAISTFDLVTEIVRVGSRVTHATARIEGENGVMTFASATLCKERKSGERYVIAKMPEVEPAAEVPSFPAGVPGVPLFLEHVDTRFCGPTMPFSSSCEAKVAAWVRLREPSVVDAPLAALLIDTLPPAITATFGTRRALASVDFTIHFFAELPLADAAIDEHYLVAIASRWADGGYVEELRDLWSPRGVLLAQCRQLIALL